MSRIDELRKRYDENQRRFFAPLANEYRKAGDLEQAIALCRMHLAEAPNNISGQIVFGQALYDAGTLDESRTVFETAIGLDPENLIALRHLGDIARAQHDVPKAREWYQRVLDADRRNEDVLALMAELETLDITVPDAPAAAAGGETLELVDMSAPAETAPDAAQPLPAVLGARAPMSSSASLTGTGTPTLRIEAVPAPAPEPEPAPPEEFEPPAQTSDERAAANTPDSSFGFDVDLDAAAHIPVAHAHDTDDTTPDFGVVALPPESAFSDAEPDHTPAHEAPMEIALEAPMEEAPIAEQETVEIAAVEMPSVLEYIEEAPAPVPAPPTDDLLDLELDTPPAPPPAAEPAFAVFELTAPVEAPEAAAAPEPAPAFVPEPHAEAPASSEAFATETMAELYVQQGLRQEAIGVYRQLVAARPDDAALLARLGELVADGRRSGGSTARAFFANLAGRRATPLRTSVIIDEPPRATTPVDVPVVTAADAAPAVEEPPLAPAETTSGTLDALFGHSNVATPDNSAAQTLAAAFASTPTPPSGRPTRAANDELSLDRVFREGSSTPPKGALAVPRQSTSLRFDQFFTPPADTPGSAPPPPPPPTDKGGESEQFQSWLTGLKKP